MKDKMSISGSNNQLPKELTEYIHTLLTEVLINGEDLNRFRKWLKKYCDEYDSSFDEIQLSIVDFTELLREYKVKSSNLMKRLLFQTGYKLFLTDIQINKFIEHKETTIKDNTFDTINHGHKNVTANWFNTEQRRTQWWNQLEEQWKRAFNEMIMEVSTIEKIPDDVIIDIFNMKRILVVGKDGYMLDEDIELNIKTLSFKLDNLSGIKDLTNLTSLWCNNNDLDSIKELQFLPNLNFLNISDNILSDLKPISLLVKLEDLMCGDNIFETLVDIGKLKKLVFLNCENNKLTNLQGIAYLTNLQTLDFSNNDITDLSGVESLSNLNYLICSDNSIEILDPLEELFNNLNTNAFNLYLYDNPIRNVKFNDEIVSEATYLEATFSWLSIYYNDSVIGEETKQETYEITNHSGEVIDDSNKYYFDPPDEIGDIISKESTISNDNSGQKKGVCSFVGTKGVSYMVGTRNGQKLISTNTLVFLKDYDVVMGVTDNYEETISGDRFVGTSYFINWIHLEKSIFSVNNSYGYKPGLSFCYAAEFVWSKFKYESVYDHFSDNGFVDFIFTSSSNSYLRINRESINHYKKNGHLASSFNFSSLEVLTNPGVFHFRDKSNYKKSMISTTGEIVIYRSSIHNFKIFLWLINDLTGYDLK